ncbi:transposase [Micromonospora sp. U56]|uniref:transposase n=1 Tax=Micromonospora sp. U56 TaxID=2824900 RepID=UPI001B380615|nr:transposase [Micromonospora sp. U56]MBQ0895649.1 transposase [Micromonospora sp. U56]
MARQKRTYSQEYRDEAVKMVIETSRPIAVVARELGLLEGTLGNWVNAYRKSHPVEEQPLAMPERARLKELERENRELRMQNEFLKKGVPRTREAA